MKVWMMLLMTALFSVEAIAADLVGITAGDINVYIPQLKVRQVKNITHNVHANIAAIQKKYKGDFGKWENAQELKTGSLWMQIAGKACDEYRYFALSHVQRHFLIIDETLFFQMSADMVCAD